MKITARLSLLIFIQVTVLAAVAITGYLALTTSLKTVEVYERGLNRYLTIEQGLLGVVRNEIEDSALDMYRGLITWEVAQRRLSEGLRKFDAAWNNYLSTLSPIEQEYTADLFNYAILEVRRAADQLETLFVQRERRNLELFINNDLDAFLLPYYENFEGKLAREQFVAGQLLDASRIASQQFILVSDLVAAIGAIVAIFLGIVIRNSISRPISLIANTVQQVADGNYEVRTRLATRDELGQLAQALDQLLQDRVGSLADAQRENEVLNNSIISLLQAVYQLSQKDLTVRVPVTEDVTGPVADALNLLTNETARVLSGVNLISEQVAQASDKVKSQSDTVIAVADEERRQVEETAAELNRAAEVMQRIAQLAAECNIAAERTINTTRDAQDTVNDTVAGINATRDTIRETEKRIKRLGERSQEISGVVNLINSIAERTQILALNASMHAASAGEAGRGFAVVANEVQRLAEQARNATAQITTLVSTIQAETAEALDTMNNTIAQVVEGSRLAEQAGQQMLSTERSTADLVAAVRQIATRSQEQAVVSQGLRERADAIRESTRQTSHQLQEQTQQTDSLVRYSQELLASVRVFHLPASDNDETSLRPTTAHQAA